MDYYKVLEIPKGAGEADIKKAYRRLSKRYHPDANPGDAQAEKRFMEISEAYSVLGDKEKRMAYDRQQEEVPKSKEKQKMNRGKSTAGEPFPMNRKNSANPIDTSDLFEKYMGFQFKGR